VKEFLKKTPSEIKTPEKISSEKKKQENTPSEKERQKPEVEREKQVSRQNTYSTIGNIFFLQVA